MEPPNPIQPPNPYDDLYGQDPYNAPGSAENPYNTPGSSDNPYNTPGSANPYSVNNPYTPDSPGNPYSVNNPYTPDSPGNPYNVNNPYTPHSVSGSYKSGPEYQENTPSYNAGSAQKSAPPEMKPDEPETNGRTYFSNPSNQLSGGLRTIVGCLPTLLILFIIGSLLSFALNIRLIWGSTTIPVGNQPTLIVNYPFVNQSVISEASVQIHASTDNKQIVIQRSRILNLPFGFAETYKISTDQRVIIYDIETLNPEIVSISVPEGINLEINTYSANIQVEGLKGYASLVAYHGSVTVKNSHLTGASLLQSYEGDVIVTNSQLESSTVLDNYKGKIDFQGSLASDGIYQFSNGSGDISLTLPQNTNVHIDAQTNNNGKISSNIPQMNVSNQSSRSTLQKDLGKSPRALLKLSNNGGTITINEQGKE